MNATVKFCVHIRAKTYKINVVTLPERIPSLINLNYHIHSSFNCIKRIFTRESWNPVPLFKCLSCTLFGYANRSRYTRERKTIKAYLRYLSLIRWHVIPKKESDYCFLDTPVIQNCVTYVTH